MLVRAALLCILTLAAMPHALAQDGNWPAWRGDGSGVSRESDLPVEWSDDEGIAWTARIRGTGNSSPIVWGDRIFVTTSMPRRLSSVLDQALFWTSIVGLAALAVLLSQAAIALVRRREGKPAGTQPAWLRALLGLESLAVLAITGLFGWRLMTLLLTGQSTMSPQDPDRTWIMTGEVVALGLIAAVGSLRARTWLRLSGVVMLALAAGAFTFNQPPGRSTIPVPIASQLGVLRPLVVATALLGLMWIVARVAARRGASPNPSRRGLRAGILLAMASLTFGFYNFAEPLLGLRRSLIAVDRDSGDIVWQRGVMAPSGRKWATNSYATPTPTTNGEYVVADFGPVMIVTDFDGRLVWERREPLYMEYLRYGTASSPVIWEDRVIYAYFPENPDTGQGRITDERSYAVALDLATGEELWRVDSIPGGRDVYSNPLVLPTTQGVSVVFGVEDNAHAYDIATGSHLWTFEIPMDHPVPSVVADATTVYMAGGIYGPAAVAAIDLESGGAPSGDHARRLEARWSDHRGTPEISSPIVYEGLIYWITENGRMYCRDALTGETVWRQRLEGHFTSSPVAGDGKLYLQATDGKILVLRAGREFVLLAENQIGLERQSNASPAIAGGRIYVRGGNNLYSIIGTPRREPAETPSTAGQ